MGFVGFWLFALFACLGFSILLYFGVLSIWDFLMIWIGGIVGFVGVCLWVLV